MSAFFAAVPNPSTDERLRRSIPAILLGFAFVAVVSLIGVATLDVRADDGGMMSFLLSEAARGHVSHQAAAAPRAERFAVVEPHGRRLLARRKARRTLLAHLRRHRFMIVAARPAPREDAAPDRSAAPQTVERLLPSIADDKLLTDRTLRAGDVIVTKAGVRIFAGADHFPYRDADFLSLTASRRPQQLATLQEIDRTVRGFRPVGAAARTLIASRAHTPEASKASVGAMAYASESRRAAYPEFRRVLRDDSGAGVKREALD